MVDDEEDDEDEGIAAPVESTEEGNSLPQIPRRGFIKNMLRREKKFGVRGWSKEREAFLNDWN